VSRRRKLMIIIAVVVLAAAGLTAHQLVWPDLPPVPSPATSTRT